MSEQQNGIAAEDPAGSPEVRRRRLILLLPLGVFLLLAALFLVRLFAGDPSRVPSALIGRPVPAFSLPPLEGLSGSGGTPVPGFSDAELKRGEVTIVNVWASWCAPCRQEHPLLMELAAQPGVRLLGLNYKDNPENARRFLGALGNPFGAVGVDESGRAAIDWGVYGVPETFIVGPDGTIRHKHIGPLTPDSLNGTFLPALRAAQQR
ncbi:cytochrome c biogenesis protein CcmG/thiol:disulfide interchange protein DsbE [Chelatococcus caeni]|uniref:Cytochrome c biogenesis protein CcmG/thiol:disulfide interchange protein DsbE n=1 Tax=Chelatococcus caeni TaxID=1348468 RepID=A0A840C6F4_9HYPH|nr:DsbE family thiol:disulfide interchange protein [Chelatococcus caeni]MBB4019178.1 cytochrome c biogenesis protein CcmG/thiol:disulfide interchange protein DsbE [Chelatococcus caeni]